MSGTLTMTYTLKEFAAESDDALKAEPGPAPRRRARHVSRAMTESGIRGDHLKDARRRQPARDPF